MRVVTRVTRGGVGVLGIVEVGLVAVGRGSGGLEAIRVVCRGAGVRCREAGAEVTILILRGQGVGLTQPAEVALGHLPGQFQCQGPSPVQCRHLGQKAMLVAEAALLQFHGLRPPRRGEEEVAATPAALHHLQELHDCLDPFTHLHHHPAEHAAGVLAIATALCREVAVLAAHPLAAAVEPGA